MGDTHILVHRGAGEIKLQYERIERMARKDHRLPTLINNIDLNATGRRIKYLVGEHVDGIGPIAWFLVYRMAVRKRAECQKSAELIPWLISMSHRLDYIVVCLTVRRQPIDIRLPSSKRLLDQLRPICSEATINRLVLTPGQQHPIKTSLARLMLTVIHHTIEDYAYGGEGLAGHQIIIGGIEFKDIAMDDPLLIAAVRKYPAAREKYDELFENYNAPVLDLVDND